MSKRSPVNQALRIFRHSSIPLAIVASCGVIALLGADRWILHNLEKQRELTFKHDISTISLELSENVLTSNYTNIDRLLLRILEADSHISCLVVTGNNDNILSIASRRTSGIPASIKYGKPPKHCALTKYTSPTPLTQGGNFYASSPIRNSNLVIGRITGHAVGNESDLALIRSIELILFGAFGVAFLPAFGVLSWSSNRQLKLEQEKTARVSGLMSQLEEAQGRTRAAFEGSNDGWIEWNVSTDSCTPSAKMQQLLGYSAAQDEESIQNLVLEEYLQELVTIKDRVKLNSFLDNLRQENWGKESVAMPGIELQILPINSKSALTLKIEAIITEMVNNKPFSVAIVANNITHDKEQQRRINRLAFYDTLTGLRNRFSFSEEIKNAEKECRQNKYRVAVFAIDIDNFKFLNDSHGHSSGDQFLIQAANRIKSCTRENDFVARLGGDEFVIIFKLPYTKKTDLEAVIKKIAEKLLVKLSQSYILKNCTAYNTCSIGICIDTIDSNSKASLLDKADIALYKAKEAGRNCFFIYESGMASMVFSKAATAQNLKKLIEEGKTSLHLQPIIRLSNAQDPTNNNQEIVGYEALFRCKDLKKSIQYLISCAEEIGIISLITESILDGLKVQLSKNHYSENVYISINISPLEFLESGFPAKFLDRLRCRNINPHRIYIEITETAVIKNSTRALDHMNLLREEGIRFSLDDFGTGFASIELLRKLPFTSVKIDRSYIENIEQDSGIKLVKSIIEMGKAFNMTLIGEGVETISQKTTLTSLGCEYAQGFLFNNYRERRGS